MDEVDFFARAASGIPGLLFCLGGSGKDGDKKTVKSVKSVPKERR